MDTNLRQTGRTTTSPLEAFGIVTLCFGVAIFSSIHYMVDGFNAGAFSDSGLIVNMLIQVVLGVAALCVLHRRNYAISTLYPNPNLKGVGIGILLYAGILVAYWIFVVPLYQEQGIQPIQQMVSNAKVSLITVIPTAIVNAAYEEIFLLGFLLRGIRKYGTATAIGISLFVRLLYHLYQGPLGALSVVSVGLIFGIYYVRTENLFPVVFAHILADIIPFL